jgi:hypothetical protein
VSSIAQIRFCHGVNNSTSPHGMWRLSVTERPVVLSPFVEGKHHAAIIQLTNADVPAIRAATRLLPHL